MLILYPLLIIFQNPNNRKFDKAEKITRQYMIDPNARFASYPTMLIDPLVYIHHWRYARLKNDKFLGSIADIVTGVGNELM